MSFCVSFSFFSSERRASIAAIILLFAVLFGPTMNVAGAKMDRGVLDPAEVL